MVTPVDDIIISNQITYDVSGGDTTLDLGAYTGFKVGIGLDLVSLNETGITFTAVQSNDGESWTPIKIKTDILEIDNTTGNDDLALITDVYYLRTLGLKIDGLSQAATGTVIISLSFK